MKARTGVAVSLEVKHLYNRLDLSFDTHKSEIYFVGQNQVLFDVAKLQPFHARPHKLFAVV